MHKIYSIKFNSAKEQSNNRDVVTLLTVIYIKKLK